jgi:hypothetical protein
MIVSDPCSIFRQGLFAGLKPQGRNVAITAPDNSTCSIYTVHFVSSHLQSCLRELRQIFISQKSPNTWDKLRVSPIIFRIDFFIHQRSTEASQSSQLWLFGVTIESFILPRFLSHCKHFRSPLTGGWHNAPSCCARRFVFPASNW